MNVYEVHARYKKVGEKDTVVLSSPEKVFSFMKHRVWKSNPCETFWVIGMDSSNRELYIHSIPGMLDAVMLSVREIARVILATPTVSFIVCHNHPSGNLFPSEEDKNLTDKIKSAADLLGIRFLDHVILTTDASYSFQSHGLL